LNNERTLLLVPVKELSSAKKRMKSEISAHHGKLLENVVETIFIHTLQVINSMGLPFGVVSPSVKLLKKGLNLGAEFTYQNKGIGLNDAIEGAIASIKEKKKWKSVFVLMGDLPLLNAPELNEILTDNARGNHIGILAAWKKNVIAGTCGLYLPVTANTRLFFGKKSYISFKNYYSSNKIAFTELATVPMQSCWDLDTVSDLRQIASSVGSDKIKRVMEELITALDHCKEEEAILNPV